MKRLLAVVLIFMAAPAWAQRTELTLQAGYTTSGSIERKTFSIQDLEVEGSFTWGFAATHFFSPRLGAEVSWAQQETGIGLSTSAGSATLFDMKLGQLHGNVVYQFGAEGARLKPFVSAGLGASFFSARDMDGETKLSMGLGVGLKWLPRKSIGARLQARYNPTRLNDGSSDYCDPFGFCQNWLQQFELTGGVVLRF
jgi:outer membrane protein W